MAQYNCKKTKKELIHEDLFILWCLCPTEELDAYWIGYLDAFPEERLTVQHAKDVVCSVQMNRYSLSPDEKESLKLRIKQDVTKYKQAKRRNLFWQYAAACVVLFCSIGIGWYVQKGRNFDTINSSIVQHMCIDSTQTEITLQLTTKKKVQVIDKTPISVNQKGKIEISEKNIAAVEDEQEEEIYLNQLTVPKGRQSSILLADGTKVWVNSGTVLRFPDCFDGDDRTIYVNGEIYLEVKEDSSRPFYVETSRMKVKVLGTSFNVTAYNDDSLQAVILKEGSVSVNNYSGEEKRIKPNEMLVLDKEQMSVSNVDIYDYISWKDGFLQFNQKELKDVLNRLSHYYYLQFACSSDIEKLKCSGKLILFENVEQVLHTLQKSLPITYEIKGNVIELKRSIS